MSAYSLFNEFSRFACENKLTLSVFVNMSFKYNKLFIQYIIYCLKYAFPVTGGHGAAARSFSAKIAAAYVKKKLTLRNSTKFFLTSQKAYPRSLRNTPPMTRLWCAILFSYLFSGRIRVQDKDHCGGSRRIRSCRRRGLCARSLPRPGCARLSG